MSAAHDSHQTPLLQGEPEHWAPKPLGWRLLFNDRLLWLALTVSAIAHLVLLAPRYGIRLPERSDKSLNVSFRAASQPMAGTRPATRVPQQHEPIERKSLKATPTKPASTSKSSQPSRANSAATTSAVAMLSPAELLARSTQSAVSESAATSSGGASGNRRITLTPNMKDYRYSQYLTDWRLKVERIGAMNYPEEARGRFFGSLVLSVALRPDGSVDRIIVIRSSGNKVLDEAAKRIVMMAAPFAPFPPDIRKETDYLDITRTWTFTRSNALETR